MNTPCTRRFHTREPWVPATHEALSPQPGSDEYALRIYQSRSDDSTLPAGSPAGSFTFHWPQLRSGDSDPGYHPFGVSDVLVAVANRRASPPARGCRRFATGGREPRGWQAPTATLCDPTGSCSLPPGLPRRGGNSQLPTRPGFSRSPVGLALTESATRRQLDTFWRIGLIG